MTGKESPHYSTTAQDPLNLNTPSSPHLAPTRPQESAFSKRAVKPNPLLKGRDEHRQRQRDLFMRKVEQGRDDKRWEGRSDQVWFINFDRVSIDAMC
jgi:hypothetical protein